MPTAAASCARAAPSWPSRPPSSTPCSRSAIHAGLVPKPAHVAGREQPLVQRTEDPGRTLLPVDGQVRAGDVGDEQRIPGEHRPGALPVAGIVVEDERGVLGPVPRRVQRAYAHAPQLELPAVLEWRVV